MASADSPALPPGIESAGVTLNLEEALDFIKDKAKRDPGKDAVWGRSIVEAICACFTGDKKLLPVYKFTIQFLDVFWGLLCKDILESPPRFSNSN